MIKSRRNPRRYTKTDMDSVKARRQRLGIDPNTDLQLLHRCEGLWNNLSSFREQRARAIEHAYGDMWSDLIEVNGMVMTQREYVSKQGNVVLQSNQIATKINTIAGLLAKEQNQPICLARDRKEQQFGEVVTEGLHANSTKNKMGLLFDTAMRDCIMGGWAIMRENYGRLFGRQDSWSYYVNPNYVFMDSAMKDPRGWDISLIGEIHSLFFSEVTEKFAQSEEDYALLRDIYTNEAYEFSENDVYDMNTKNESKNIDFWEPQDRNLCRVFEVWTKEVKPRLWVHDTAKGTLEKIDADDTKARQWIHNMNESRKAMAAAAGWKEARLIETTFFMDTYWYCRFLAPDGSILWEGESFYPDRSHPYSMCMTPFIDGKIIAVISDALDHNAGINRALTLGDWAVRAQVKGVTMVPKSLVPADMTYSEFASQWTSIDGLIFYEPKPGVPQPQVFHGSAVNFDATRLVQMYKGLMEDSINVSGALQGQTPHSGTSAALYAQQTANSSTPIASLMLRFHSFMDDVYTKKMKNIAAFYTPQQWESIVGAIDGAFDPANLNLNDIAHIEMDLNLRESTETPVYRMISNEYLMQLFNAGAISVKDLLENGAFPFADKILQGIEAREAEMQAAQQGQIPGAAPVQ
jgi:hypothetical protein